MNPFHVVVYVVVSVTCDVRSKDNPCIIARNNTIANNSAECDATLSMMSERDEMKCKVVCVFASYNDILFFESSSVFCNSIFVFQERE